MRPPASHSKTLFSSPAPAGSKPSEGSCADVDAAALPASDGFSAAVHDVPAEGTAASANAAASGISHDPVTVDFRELFSCMVRHRQPHLLPDTIPVLDPPPIQPHPRQHPVPCRPLRRMGAWCG